MLTKADFVQKIQEKVAGFPAVSLLYQAGDPRIRQQIDAMATMLAMYSAQSEVALSEPFEKTRESTVLADAALRGIIPKGTPARVSIKATNTASAPFNVEVARPLIDSAGREYLVQTAVTVPANGEETFVAVQKRSTKTTHIVSESEPFYAIEAPASDGDDYLCEIAVEDSEGDYSYTDRYMNISAGERVFNVEVDERKRVFVRFGADGLVGMQPENGDEITLTTYYTNGAISIDIGSHFTFASVVSPADAAVTLQMDSMLQAGQNPISISVLRELSRYPSSYDNNAVFLGEFDFLVRKQFKDAQFLSVWNEAQEEVARGPDIDNINCLFVACLSATGGEVVLTQDDPESPIVPNVVADADLTATQIAIKAAILNADDSYRVKFYTPVRAKIAMTINAKVPTSYLASDVKSQITSTVLAQYGQVALASRKGMTKPLYMQVYELLRKNIQALHSAKADMKVTIDEDEANSARPEMWRYVAADSLTVNVTNINDVSANWGV